MALASGETNSGGAVRTDDGYEVVAIRSAAGATAIPVSNTASTATAAALTNVSSSATNVTLLAANTARRGATFYNDSTAILYLKFGATASTSSHTVQIAAGGYFEIPFPVYTGIVDGLWASANGSVRVTELT